MAHVPLSALTLILVEEWISQVVKGDHGRGYDESRYAAPPSKQFSQEDIDALRARGIKMYFGGGNFFIADLNGERPTVTQRRPLAQRVMILEADE